jgi:HSP20 family protein
MNGLPVPYPGDEGGLSEWRPFGREPRLFGELDRLFDLFPTFDWDADAFAPPADVSESDEAFVFELDLPGVDKGDVTIEAEGRRLSVRGERREGERKGLLRRRGRVTGTFRYAWRLPSNVEPEGVQARMQGGVLTIEVPKAAPTQPRRIAIR